MALKLHIAGCGRVGRSLARLWAVRGTFRIGWVLNRGLASAESAVAFIGEGSAVAAPGPIDAGDWLMLAAPDGELAKLASNLAARIETPPALAFHVSGAEPAEVLRPLGCPVASIHPVRPFSDPALAVAGFEGTLALGEGDAAALDRALPVFDAIGARASRFEPRDKRRYHAAAIVASNFLNVLDQFALDLAESSGLDRRQALDLVVSLQRAALDGIERVGPMQSLTGPIERGDRDTCVRLAEVLQQSKDRNGALLALARGACDLADLKHGRGAGLAPNPNRELFAESGFVGGGGHDGRV